MKRLYFIVLMIASTLAGISFAESEGQDIILSLKDGQAIGRLVKDQGMRQVGQIPGQAIYLVHSTDDGDQALRKLRQDRSVESAEVNRSIQLNNGLGDPGISGFDSDSLSRLDRTTMTDFYGSSVLRAYVDQPALSIIHSADAHAISTGAGSRVAYIDTGIDATHPALEPWVLPGVDLVAGRNTSEVDSLPAGTAYRLGDDTDTVFLLDTDMIFRLDGRLQMPLVPSLQLNNALGNWSPFPAAFGHGTMVAGAIHAVAPEAKLIPIKAFDAFGNTTMFSIVDAVNRAVDLGADVINMSFSTGADSVALRKAISRAQATGIAVVAAAGNDSRYVGDAYPAGYTSVYGVAASDFQDRLASFSNYGKSVSITAPGAYVISTIPGGHYAAAWGTSFSAPLVSGAMALLSSQRPYGHSQGPMVLNSADQIDALNSGHEGDLGKGRLNVQAALVQGK